MYSNAVRASSSAGWPRYVQSGDLDLATAVDRLQEAIELLDELVPDRELGVWPALAP